VAVASPSRFGRCQDQLGHRAIGEPGEQFAHAQVIRADAVDRADGPAEHVIAPTELAGALDGDNILRLLDDEITLGSRRASRQIRHSSASATLPQMRQNRTSFFTRMSVLASRSTSTGSAESKWNAMRWALFGPTPGSRPNSSDQVLDGALVHDLQAGEAEPAQAPPSPPVTGPIFSAASSPTARLASRTAPRPDLQRLDVVRIDGLRVDLDRLQLTRTRHRGRDSPPRRCR